MKAFLLTTLAASSAFAYDGHNQNKKDHNVGIWFFENGREFARGYVFGLEGGKYKKPSQSQCVKDVDSVFYGGEDLYYDVIDLVETNFEDMVSVAQALGGFMTLMNDFKNGCDFIGYFTQLLKVFVNVDWWMGNVENISSNTTMMWQFFTLITESFVTGKYFDTGAGMGRLAFMVFGVAMD